MNEHSEHGSAKGLYLRLLEIMNTGKFEALGEVLADDFVSDWPQSGERVVGPSNLAALMRAYPGGRVGPIAETATFAERERDEFLLTPMFTMVRTEGSGDHATSAVKTHYPDGSDWYIVAMIDARNGKIAHLTQYFAPIYEAPEWRAEWVERTDQGR